MGWYYGFEAKPTIETDEGIKARSKRGAFVKNWWATRWIEAMEQLMDRGRLSRGRSYARKGQVLSVKEGPGSVTAKVQGSRRRPYSVTIGIELLTDRPVEPGDSMRWSTGPFSWHSSWPVRCLRILRMRLRTPASLCFPLRHGRSPRTVVVPIGRRSASIWRQRTTFWPNGLTKIRSCSSACAANPRMICWTR